NFVALVVHGLQAISVFIEIVTVRLLLTVCLLACSCGALLGLTLAAKFCGFAPPAWTPYVFGGLLIVTLCLALGSLSTSLRFLAQRNSLDFIPIRDYQLFVEGIYELSPRSKKLLTLCPEPSEDSLPAANE